MRTLAVLALLLVATSARADIPAFTPNVVDPSHRLDAAATQTVNDVLAEMKLQADIRGAVYIADSLEGQSVEALAHEAFEAWHLGEAGKDNGLLLVLAMDEHRMRFEVGYGLEGQLTDLVCQHALDDFVRPQMRAGDVKQALVDGLFAVTRAKRADFHVAADVHFSPPKERGDFDAPFGVRVWAGYAVLLVALFASLRKLRKGWFVLLFSLVNPGVFIFAGGAVLSAKRVEALAAVHELLSPQNQRLALDWCLAHLVLVPFFLAIAFIARYAVKRYVPELVQRESALLDADPQLRELDEQYLRLSHGKRLGTTNLGLFARAAGVGAPSLVLMLGFSFGVDFAHVPVLLVGIPVVVFGLATLVATRLMQRYRSPEAYRAYLAGRIERLTAQMEALVRRGYATRSDDGGYTYTAAYYASQSSSSSGSSFSSSSGGGSSGGGGASSSW